MMAALPSLPLRRICLNCIRRSVVEDLPQIRRPTGMQIRGKTKKAKDQKTLNVRLLVDMPGYGRKGAITPVAPGKMRNSWYPRQHAEYVSTLADIDPKTVDAVRDFEYGMDIAKAAEPTAAEPASDPVPKTPKRRVKLLDPQLATKLLSETLPAKIIFYRTHIDAESTGEAPLPGSRRATSQSAAETYSDSAVEPPPEEEAAPATPKLQSIFGSVSTLDIADSVQEVLRKSEKTKGESEAAIVIGAEDIAISADTIQGAVEKSEGGDRLKALGDFNVEIRVKGGEVVKRVVSVRQPEPIAS